LRGDHRSLARLVRAGYRELSCRHTIYKQYIPSAFEVALGVLKAHRRRLRRKKRSSVPYMRKLMLKAENQSYWLDRETGRLRIPIRGTEGVQLQLPLSDWHRSFLSDPCWSLGSLTAVPGKIIVVVRMEAPKPYESERAIALDTNEDSLDGVVASDEGMIPTVLPFGGVRRIQETHFRRRRRLATKKAGDRRVMRRLLNREGRRERNRVRQRLHLVSKRLVQFAKSGKAAIVLEDLTLHGAGGRSRRMNRRLSSWPRSEIHRQIEYKAALAGVPIIKVNPAWTSKTCPVCGARRRDRVGQDFVCLMCDWEMDRQINAGLNILKTALASNEALARAVRFQPGALRHDAMSPLYDLSAWPTGAREEPSGVESHARSVRRSQSRGTEPEAGALMMSFPELLTTSGRQSRCKLPENARGGSRTHDRPLRRRSPYPLGHPGLLRVGENAI
jgi:putative transposase